MKRKADASEESAAKKKKAAEHQAKKEDLVRLASLYALINYSE